MVNHGLSTGGLFALVGMLYERYHTREIAQLGGVARRLPRLAALMVFFTLASIGLPGLNGFVGEFLVLLGMFRRAFVMPPAAWAWQWQVIAVAAVAGVVLGAWYMLWLIQRVFFGPLREPPTAHGATAVPRLGGEPVPGSPPQRAAPAAGQGEAHFVPADLSLRELCALAPLVVWILWIGLVPQRLIAPAQAALDEALARPAARLIEIQRAGTPARVAGMAVPHEEVGDVR